MKVTKPKRILLLVFLLANLMGAAGEEDWILGVWELVHDPDGSRTDWLDFQPDGVVFSIWPDGQRVEGIYIVTSDRVKVVFTRDERDVIATFHFDAARRMLKIVTSETGEESLYRKADRPPAPPPAQRL